MGKGLSSRGGTCSLLPWWVGLAEQENLNVLRKKINRVKWHQERANDTNADNAFICLKNI